MTCYFTESRIQEGILKTQLAEKDPVEEENEERHNVQNEAAIAERKPNFEAQDPLVEVNLGINEEPRTTKISGLLPKKIQYQLVQLVRRYRDYFAWDDHEIPGPSRKLVEH